MAILIKGEEIDQLVRKYCAMTGQKNKSEAVRQALAAQIDAISSQESLAAKVAKIQQQAANAGFTSSGDDLKPFMDDMWGEN